MRLLLLGVTLLAFFIPQFQSDKCSMGSFVANFTLAYGLKDRIKIDCESLETCQQNCTRSLSCRHSQLWKENEQNVFVAGIFPNSGPDKFELHCCGMQGYKVLKCMDHFFNMGKFLSLNISDFDLTVDSRDTIFRDMRIIPTLDKNGNAGHYKVHIEICHLENETSGCLLDANGDEAKSEPKKLKNPSKKKPLTKIDWIPCGSGCPVNNWLGLVIGIKTEKTCDKVPEVSNGVVTYTNEDQGKIQTGGTASLECHAGYRADSSGSTPLSCNLGRWEPDSLPGCAEDIDPTVKSCSANIKDRVNCGGGGPIICKSRGCCFNSQTRKVFWCFYEVPKWACSVNPESRVRCAPPGVASADCLKMGCCFDLVTGRPDIVDCFRPA